MRDDSILRKRALSSGSDSPLPLYRQIQDHLRDLISSGKLRVGDRLPSESQLAAKFKTTRSTVTHAIQRLVFEQVLVREVGRGSFVAPPPLEPSIIPPTVQSLEGQLEELGKAVSYRLIRFGLVSPDARIAKALKTAPRKDVYHLERLRIADGTPISLEVRHVPEKIGCRFTVGALEKLSFVDILQDHLGLAVNKIVGIVSCLGASKEQAEFLRVPKNSPLLFREYVFYGPDNTPISHGMSYYRSEVRFKYVVRRN
jgi:GntR family transcriptional regulator